MYFGGNMERIRRRAFTPYYEALDGFTKARKELNDCINKGGRVFLEKFEEYVRSNVLLFPICFF